jgi:nucleoside-diphosphate-sugar epimerase
MVGCGDLGARIAHALNRRHQQVWTLTRSGGGPWPALCGDVTNPQSLPPLAGRIGTLVYCLTPQAREESAYRRIFVEGLRHVIAAASAEAVPRVCLVSSTAVYGDAGGGWVDEDSECRPDGFNGRVLREAESLCLSAGPENLVFRLGGIYGPGRDSLIRKARARAFDDSEASDWGNRIHVEDAAEAIAQLVVSRHRGIFNIVDPSPAAPTEVVAWIAAQLGLLESPAGGTARNLGGRRISSRRLAEVGFSWRYPDYRSGYAELIRP